MTQSILTAATLVTLFALGSMPAQAEAEKKIRVELKLGQTYSLALGQSASQKTKQLAEETLANTLNNKIKYFDFVPSGEVGSHTLTFRIDEPNANDGPNGSASNLSDFYVFLDFNKDNDADIDQSLHWLFRDAASSLNGVDTPETIAEKLGQDVQSVQYDKIAKELLSKASFTDKARFKSDGAKGWVIEHSRQSLCLAPDSKLQIESLVPPEGFEERFLAEVKRRQSGDETSTFTRGKEEEMQTLMSDPLQARVLAVYVVSYQAECESTITESLPGSISFAGGNP